MGQTQNRARAELAAVKSNGQIRKVADVQNKMRVAEEMFMRFVPLAKIAAEVDERQSLVEHWAFVFGWYATRQEKERGIYETALGAVRDVSETMGAQEDEIGAGFQALVARWLDEQRDSGCVDVENLPRMVRAMKDAQALRRLVHDKATEIQSQKVEIAGTASIAVADLTKMLEDVQRLAPTGHSRVMVSDLEPVEDLKYDVRQDPD